MARPKNPDTLQMEHSVDRIAASRMKRRFTRQDVVSDFLKRNKQAREDIKSLEELDRRNHEAGITPCDKHPLRDNELRRLHQLAGSVMRGEMEPEFRLHRRFAAVRLPGLDGKDDWFWFEVRFAHVNDLKLWNSMRDDQRTGIGINIDKTQVIIDFALRAGTTSVNKIYARAMAEIGGEEMAA